LWGEIIFKTYTSYSPDLYMELGNPKVLGVIFGKAVIHSNGKFLLRSSPGKYELTVYIADKTGERRVLGKMPIKIGKSGVFNSTLVIK
jgi:hypothetical protein